MIYRPLVLCYHAISDAWPHGLAVAPEALERQLRAVLARGYRPGGAEIALDPGTKAFHVTFDDAYRSVEAALPALERTGARATVFACSGRADNGGPLDVPELAEEAARYPDELATMDWDALRSLAERGVEIGSHTITHAHLTKLGDDELRRELTEAKARIEDELGKPCRFVAYPYGEDDARVHDAARAAGYDGGFSLRGERSGSNRFALPRVDVYRKDTRLRFSLKASPLVRELALALRR